MIRVAACSCPLVSITVTFSNANSPSVIPAGNWNATVPLASIVPSVLKVGSVNVTLQAVVAARVAAGFTKSIPVPQLFVISALIAV